MEDYAWHMQQAAKYREMLKYLDGYQQRAVLGAAIKSERLAEQLKRQSRPPGSEDRSPSVSH